MKKLIKNEICGSVNSTRMHYSRKTGQKLQLLFMYRTWTVAACGGENAWKKKKKGKRINLKRSKRGSKLCHSVCLGWRLLRCVSVSTFSPFFFSFFFTCFPPYKRPLFMYGTWTVAATFDQFYVNSASVHCSRTHKFHFLSIFLLKMGPTVLFTHLKIILLQWFQQ